MIKIRGTGSVAGPDNHLMGIVVKAYFGDYLWGSGNYSNLRHCRLSEHARSFLCFGKLLSEEFRNLVSLESESSSSNWCTALWPARRPFGRPIIFRSDADPFRPVARFDQRWFDNPFVLGD